MKTRSTLCPFLSVLLLLAGWLAIVTPLRADNPPTYLFQWGSSGSGSGQVSDPFSVAVDSSNNVYVVDQGNQRVEKFDSHGNYLTQWGSESLSGVAVDSSNNVYVDDIDNA